VLSDGCGEIFATVPSSPEGLEGLQHECSMGTLPQLDIIWRQHSISTALNVAPGIKQNMDGASSVDTTIRPIMRCVRFMVLSERMILDPLSLSDF
jgi:hypothetical protein